MDILKEDLKLVGLREEGERMNEVRWNRGRKSTQHFTLCAICPGSASPARLFCQLTSTKHIDDAASTPLMVSACRRSVFKNCHQHLSATALILNTSIQWHLTVAECASVFRCLVQHCLSGWSNKCQSQLQPRTGLDLQSNMKSSAGTQTNEVEVRHTAQCLMCLWCVCCGVCLQTSDSC